ncbi:transposase is4 [Holotrichia oblita]|uniref:Transposase is4 n=1 Tax=Holotrichia oblita TaxID=644536 RepID=A0ACB9TBX0_HOLOL|nr:transposase is4 [Holotrichia oblita]
MVNTQTEDCIGPANMRPLVDIRNQNFKNHRGLDENLSIDESVIPYFTTVFSESQSGKNSNKEKHFDFDGDVVVSLLEQADVPNNKGHKVYFDNYFTGLPLLAHLSDFKYCATGTIRENRIEQCPVPSKKAWDGVANIGIFQQ